MYYLLFVYFIVVYLFIFETKRLSDGFHQSFTDENKFIKKNIAVELQTFA